MENQTNCKHHTDQKLLFLCLDQTCNKSSKACVFCIKSQHGDCDENFIINIDQIQDKVVIKKSDDISNIEKEVSQRIEQEFNNFFDFLENEKNYILEGFQSPNDNINNLTVQEVQKYKQFFDISKNVKNKKVIIQSKINPKQENIEEDIEYFKAKLQNKMDVGSRFLDDTIFYNTQILSKDIFEIFGCELQKKYNGLELQKIKTERLSIIYTKKPIKNFKLKISGKRNENICVFLTTQRHLKNIKKRKTIDNNKDAIGIISYMRGQNMQGQNSLGSYGFEEQYKLQTGQKDIDIFGNHNIKDDFIDFQLYCEYSKSNNIFKIYTRDKRVDLKKDQMSDQKYYLIIGVFSDYKPILIESYGS